MTGISISVVHSIEITDNDIFLVANELRECFQDALNAFAINGNMADRASIQRSLFQMVVEQMIDPEKYNWTI